MKRALLKVLFEINVDVSLHKKADITKQTIMVGISMNGDCLFTIVQSDTFLLSSLYINFIFH